MRPNLLHRAFTLGLLLATVACGSNGVEATPFASAPATTASPEATDSSAPMPESAAPSPSAGAESPYPIGTVIQVLAEAIRLRQTPDTSADIVSAMTRDMTASVIGGPTDSDGYTWLEVDGPSGTGWVATGDSEDRWIVAVPDFERAELAFRFRSMCDATPPLVPPTLAITADREVIMASPDDGRLLAGRLSPAAFAEVMGVLDHPALAESATYRPELRPDAGEPPGHGLCVFEFTLGPPSERVRVTSVSWFGDEEEEAYYVPSPERRALDEMARGFMVAPELFTDASWDAPLGEYQPAAFLVWIWPEAASPTPGVPSLTDLDVIGDPATFGEPIDSGRCGYLDRASAEAMAEAFSGTPTPLRLNAVSYLTVQTDSGWATIVTSPLTPDGFPTCGDIPG